MVVVSCSGSSKLQCYIVVSAVVVVSCNGSSKLQW